MQSPNPRPGRTGRPPRLSRDTILVAAQRVLDEEGPEHLSMRRLAKELSSTPMALYHHVRDKDELLLLLLDAHVRRIPRTEFPGDPRERLITGAQVLHDILAGSPWGVEVLASGKFVSDSATWLVESIVDALKVCGLSPADADYAYRVIWSYIVGELTARSQRERAASRAARPARQRVTTTPGGTATAEGPVTPGGTAPPEGQATAEGPDRPQLTACAGRADDQRRGLEAVIDGLLTQNTR